MRSPKIVNEKIFQSNRPFRLGLAMTIILFCCQSCQNGGGKTIVEIQGSKWVINGEPVLKGSPAEGLLMNVRMVNAVFEDEGLRCSARCKKRGNHAVWLGRF
jgi:hypothetical protein